MKKIAFISTILHVAIVIAGYWALYLMGDIEQLPDDYNLINWDAVFFKSIVTDGYEYIPYTGTNLAFFPLFPLLWKITGLSAIGISVLNIIVFSTSFILLFKDKTEELMILLLLLSIPSFIFFALPYSESLFFLFGTCILIGYQRGSGILKNIGFLGASIVKSASIIFIPAIILCEIFGKDRGQIQKRDIYINGLFSLLGLMIGAIVQGVQTGKWFYFLEMQQYWGRHWIVPELPLVSSVAYDGVAFIIGLIAIYFCLKLFVTRLIDPKAPVQLNTKHVSFSALYLSATTFLDTFFTYNNGGGSLWSLNRHLLCTPFAIIFIFWLIRNAILTKIDKMVIMTMIILGLVIPGVYRSWEMILYYTVFMAAILLIKIFPEEKRPLYFMYIFQVYVQLSFFEMFITGQWIG